MSRFEAVNLIRLFDFYLAAMFVLNFARRYTVYWDALRLAVGLRGRWPTLVERLRQHHGLLLTRDVLRPLGVALGLILIQLICSRVIWPQAELTVAEVTESWWQAIVVGLAMLPMLAVDAYFLIRVGRFDRGETELWFDQAEHWLRTWKTPLIRAATLGYVNPQRIVDEEVRKGMVQIGETVSWVAWWMSAQVGCRVVFGLTIWMLWALAK
jgi:hypothetical protein